MPNPVIKAENLSKLYRLGEVGTGTLSHDLNRWWARLRGKEDPFTKVGQVNDRTKQAVKGEHVWALQDINFEVEQGEVLGIIGKNGAGKSTLLKILSKITSPTRGCIKAKGRIASLLEVGTGMHMEMTGRENIYLNGTILGMKRWEVDRKLDEIISFAGVEKYLDTPVKRYSSGMKVRLAFSVAAHLDPEILIIDEVLAVGDSAFKKKCLDKIAEIAQSGRTILFVSHNMQAVKNLCKRSVYIKDGKLVEDNDTDVTIHKYLLDAQIANQKENHLEHVIRTKKGLKGELIFSKAIFNKEVFQAGDDLILDLYLKCNSKNNQVYKDLLFGVNVFDEVGNNVYHLSNLFVGVDQLEFNDSNFYRIKIPGINLKEGRYTLNLFLRANEEIHDWIFNAIAFEIEESNIYGFNNSTMIQGLVQPEFEFMVLNEKEVQSIY